jgi:acetolactate synthase-1/2/3 large subunit
MTDDGTSTVGEALVELLARHGVEIVFGIPGVHTVELYRGLARSPIRHVTPRHEQGAGFMADGYARVSGRPGVCLVITGPGLTNTLTAMAQARQDSVPMLVISGVGKRSTLGHGRGALHELPDQHALAGTVALWSHTLLNPGDLAEVVARAFATFASSRPGPVHIEIPVDVVSEHVALGAFTPLPDLTPAADAASIERAARLCEAAERPLVIAGGGARRADAALRALAERLDAPVITTTNGRGLLAGHALEVPASPSLAPVRDALADADLVVAVGTEFGLTDFDMYEDGGFPALRSLIRIDIDRDQLARPPQAAVGIVSNADAALSSLSQAFEARRNDGAARAKMLRENAWGTLDAKAQAEIGILSTIAKACPGCLLVGDSTQLVYSGNLYCKIEDPGGWFNAATGYGALGYGPPAAIGAALAAPDRPVICIVGDGGLQFSLAEIGAAIDERTPVIFLVWNNDGYREIENYMISVSIEPEGVRPSAPDFARIAEAYGLHAETIEGTADLSAALDRARRSGRAALIDLRTP